MAIWVKCLDFQMRQSQRRITKAETHNFQLISNNGTPALDNLKLNWTKENQHWTREN